jgi:hypothetical protein
LPGMIEEPGSFSGISSSAKPARGPQDRKGAQRGRQLHQPVMRPLQRKFVRRTNERQPRQLRNLSHGRVGKAGFRVDPGTDCGAAQRQRINAVQRRLYAREVIRQHRSIARPFLPKREGRRVLHVGAADFDDAGPLSGFGRDRITQPGDCRGKPFGDMGRRRNVHRRRKGVVRGLRHVDVVIRMHRLLAAERRAGVLAAPIGNHLVDVHVELRPAARHPDVKREHFPMLAGEDLVARRNDQPVDSIIEPAGGVVCMRRGFFQDGIGLDHFTRHQIRANAEMLERTLRLGTPELIGGDTDLAEAVGFDAELAHLLLLRRVCTVSPVFGSSGRAIGSYRRRRSAHRGR